MSIRRSTLRVWPVAAIAMLITSCNSSSTSTEPDPVTIDTTTLADGVVDEAYSASLSASGGTGTFVWSVESGALPDGLSLDDGTISGTPTAAGTFDFTVEVVSGSVSDQAELSITIVNPPVEILTTDLPDGEVGTAYSASLSAEGGDETFEWSLATGSDLPDGLSLSAAGEVTGTPTTAGETDFTVEVVSGPVSDQAELSITVLNPPVEILTTDLPDGAVGGNYSASLSAEGGDETFDWSLATGSDLPDGLSLSAAGEISGTPTVAGTTEFTVEVTSGGRTDDQVLSITIHELDCLINDCSNLEGYWRLDETSMTDGSTVADFSLNGFTGTVHTSDADDKAVPGNWGGAIQLDGDDDFVSISDDDALDFSGDFTLTAWINADAVNLGHRAIISKNVDGGRPPSLWLLHDQVQVWFTPGGEQAESVGTLTAGTWHHLAAVFDDAADEVRIYIDSVLDHTEAGVTATPDVNDHPLVIGERGDGGFYFMGAIDEVMVWSRALSDAEVAGIYGATSGL